MNTAVADNQPWALEVVTPKETVILAWSQFVFAEGDDDEIRIAFASHDIVVKGSGLSTLSPGDHSAGGEDDSPAPAT